jgi:uncharacterized coiled-coil protein SlyX|tara:strand:- start:653 stop:880 length:228 start_codon:yes stop_codon:yes gene_type:complete
MLEAVVPVGIALATGFSVLITRFHARLEKLDSRVDAFELRVAEGYVSKTDLNEALERFETHMLRIENKLDRIILK